MASVYIETTVPSAYVTARSDPGSVYRKNVTREWWEQQLGRYDAWTSDSVILELKQGDWPGQDDSLVLVEPLRRLAMTDEILGVAHTVCARTIGTPRPNRRRYPFGCRVRVRDGFSIDLEHQASGKSQQNETLD